MEVVVVGRLTFSRKRELHHGRGEEISLPQTLLLFSFGLANILRHQLGDQLLREVVVPDDHVPTTPRGISDGLVLKK